jgi:hypothetical protein
MMLAPEHSAAIAAEPEFKILLSAAGVRARSEQIFAWVLQGRSEFWSIDLDKLWHAASYVADVARDSYPDLAIPYHSRWRHFTAGGVDRWGALLARMPGDTTEQARAAVDLVTVAVLLDAGAGKSWHYSEAGTGLVLGRSEGLAAACIHMFEAGGFSSDPARPLRVDGGALERLDAEQLGQFFQVGESNPLVGLDARAALMQRLGRALRQNPALFGGLARPGCLVDHVLRADGGRIAAGMILTRLLQALSSIWPSGLVIDGVPLGDAARHPAITRADRTGGIVPFHKLSQWLTYSLIEPFQHAGIEVVDLDELTVLAEYRNGGLLVDLGVLVPRDPEALRHPHDVASLLVVEWRALTVALMDRLLPLLRAELQVGTEFTLPHMLQAGTWVAGRKIAKALRPDASEPPVMILADGTVF